MHSFYTAVCNKSCPRPSVGLKSVEHHSIRSPAPVVAPAILTSNALVPMKLMAWLTTV